MSEGRATITLVCPSCGASEFEQQATEKVSFRRLTSGSKGAKVIPIGKKLAKEFSCVECKKVYTELSELMEEF